MKVRFYNIEYQFEDDLGYQREYIIDQLESEDMTYQQIYDKEIEYLGTIREVVIDYDDDLGSIDDDLHQDLQNETGEYILNFECEILAD
jgi:hypothetical protein